jgi:5'-nucleotidase
LASLRGSAGYRTSAQALLAAAWLAVALGCASVSAPRIEGGELVHVKLIAFNDFHGYLQAPGTPLSAVDPGRPGQSIAVPTGGVAEMATLVKTLAAENPNHIVVGAGDMVGASPLISGLFLDEPSIEALNALGLEITSVGNHEFDRGVRELLRKQFGGCEITTSTPPCQAGHGFAGARFHYLAANVIDRATGEPILPAYEIRRFQGQPIGFIGVTLKGTARIVSPAGIAGVRFEDEATSVNAIVELLRKQDVHSFVLLIHQGAESPGGPLNGSRCDHFAGDIVPILERLDPDISVVVSGHTHQAYVCTYKGFLVTSAASFSRLVTDIDLSIDAHSGRVTAKSAVNRVVASASAPGTAAALAYPGLTPDATVAALVDQYALLVRPLAERPVGRIEGVLSRSNAGGSESPLGDVVADAQWAATRASAGAQLALTNPGGIRTDLQSGNGGTVSYGAVFAAQPFGNALVTLTLTGRQLKALLEQQWSAHPERPLFLQVSDSFSYAFDARRPMGDRVIADSVRIGGEPVVADHDYRVTVNSFLADGGDGFSLLLAGRDSVVGPQDAEALETYLRTHSPLAVPSLGRIRQQR